MPNSIKYSTSNQTNALGIGNMHIGTGDVQKGPTESTEFFNGINPPSDGYTIYIHKATEGSSIFTPSNDVELILMTNQIADASYTTINECFNYFEGQSGKFIIYNPINPIITDGLILNLSSNTLPSYPRSGTTWYDLSGESNNTTINSANYNNGGEYFQSVGDAPDSLIFSTPNSTTINNTFSVTSGGWTIEELIRIDDTTYPEAAAGTVVSNRAYGATNTGFDWNHGVRSGTSLNIDMSNKDTGGGNTRDAEVNLAIDSDLQTYGQWILRSIYWDRTNDKCGVYYNGRFQDSGSISGVSGFSLYDGGGISWGTLYGWHHDGARSFMRVYNKVLSESEVKQNYYQAPIVTDGLVFAVDAGNLVSYESGSTTAYSLTGSLDGTLTNGVGFSNGNGGGWDFDGIDDYIDLGNLGLIQTDFAISLWYENGASKESFYFSTGYSNAGSILIFSDGIWINSSNNNGRLPGAPGQSIEGPTNIILTRTNGVAKWYKNGVEKGSLNYSGNITTGTNYTIGYALPRNKTTAYLEGKFYTLNIYNKGLSPSEVQQNYNANVNRFN